MDKKANEEKNTDITQVNIKIKKNLKKGEYDEKKIPDNPHYP